VEASAGLVAAVSQAAASAEAEVEGGESSEATWVVLERTQRDRKMHLLVGR